MALSNSNHHYKVYVSAMPNNVYKDDQSLESPLITFKCNIKMSYISDKPDKTIQSSIQDHDSWHEFEHPADELTRDFIESNMLADTKIPFSLTNLHWKKRVYEKESVLLTSTDCLVTSMLDVCHGMVSAAHESGRKKLFLLVFIKKEVIVPRDEFLAMLKAKQEEEVLHQVEDMVRLQAQGWNFQQSDWERMAEVVRQAGFGDSIRSALDLAMERATSASAEEAVVKLVPAAAMLIQGLEKVTCAEAISEEKCSVCMEDLVIGSEVTRMPCSHVFHGDCIVQWLKTSHMCPMCRFKLQTS